MKIDGACLCGHLRYEAEINPDQVKVCHCTDCQNGTGSFRAVVMVAASHFHLLSGTPKVYVKTAQSGHRRAISFCPDCGTQLHGSQVDNPQTFSLRLGTVNQRASLKPVLQIWCRSALPWVFDLKALPKVETQPGHPEVTNHPPQIAIHP